MSKTRLDVLTEVVGIQKEQVFIRESLLSNKLIDENSSEFIVKEGDESIYYDVLTSDEFDSRVESLIYDCYSEEEIEEMYGLNDDGTPDLSSADIETYLKLVGEKEGYFVFTPLS